ncbi:MAG: hypothetical protein EPO35_00645 [Acidobacteria bacterium]|nr:MAG: hypothetical protein EPO35_00645 [Acidobacteriota bacterium]
MSFEFSREILIDGAPADIAGVMFDPARETEWMTAVSSSVPQSRGITPGAEVKRTSNVGGSDVAWSTTVDAFHFPHILRLVIVSGGFIKYEVQRHGAGSVARIRATSHADLFGFDLEKLKGLVERA